MARKIRIEDGGFHMLRCNIKRQVIFNTSKDKEKFLDILCVKYQSIMVLLFIDMFL